MVAVRIEGTCLLVKDRHKYLSSNLFTCSQYVCDHNPLCAFCQHGVCVCERKIVDPSDLVCPLRWWKLTADHQIFTAPSNSRLHVVSLPLALGCWPLAVGEERKTHQPPYSESHEGQPHQGLMLWSSLRYWIKVCGKWKCAWKVISSKNERCLFQTWNKWPEGISSNALLNRANSSKPCDILFMRI